MRPAGKAPAWAAWQVGPTALCAACARPALPAAVCTHWLLPPWAPSAILCAAACTKSGHAAAAIDEGHCAGPKPCRERALGAGSGDCGRSSPLTPGKLVRLGRGGRAVSGCPSCPHAAALQTTMASWGRAVHRRPLLRAGAGACGHGGRGGKPGAGHAGAAGAGRAGAGGGRRPAGGRRGAALGRRGRRPVAACRQARVLSARSWKGPCQVIGLPRPWRPMLPGACDLEGLPGACKCARSRCRPAYSLASAPSKRPGAWRSAGV